MRRPALHPAAALACAALALAACQDAAAAQPVVARWNVERLPTKPSAAGAVFTVKLSAQIQPGWHLYALEEPEGGPMPTEIGLAQDDPLTLLKVEEAKPRMVPDPVLHLITGIFEGAASFTLKLRAPRVPLPAEAISHILVRYQSCNAQVCLPPHTDIVELPLKDVVQPGASSK